MTAKRLFDLCLSATALILASPILIPAMIAVWLQDFHSPFYVAPRVGLKEKIFKMYKLRSMVINADLSGVDSTAANDRRITPMGAFIRKYKLDEVTQLINVILGDMSLVGPRPNVKRETDLYTEVEKQLLSVRPGITDLASIVFADEGDILKDSPDPDSDYNRFIRPWKSRLALVSVRRASLSLDFKILYLTALAILARPKALEGVVKILTELDAPEELRKIASRREPLPAAPPPGATEIVWQRPPPAKARATESNGGGLANSTDVKE